MTNISKKLLTKSTEKKLFTQLCDLFASAKRSDTQQFFYELFTPSERIMFTKRVAAILLLSKEVSPYRVAKTLNMSPTTIGVILEQLDRGDYMAITSTAKQRNFDSEEFWKTIEVLLRLGMPSMGKDRWKALK